MSETQTVTPTPATPTAARPKPKGGGHWYSLDGTPMHEVPKKTGKPGEMRATNLADARKLNLLPSVTTILGILDKPALNTWLTEQACLAIATSPRNPGEEDDAFVYRILHEEKQQDQEAQIARDKGTAIHAAIESYFNGQPVPPEWAPYVNAPINAVLAFGEKASSEIVLTGDDYAGTADLLVDCADHWRLVDWKSSKKLPDPAKGAYDEHRLQLSAYAKALQQKFIRAGQGLRPIIPVNVYVSTQNPGEYVICEHEGWEQTYERGFAPLVTFWQWQTGYRPENPNREDTHTPLLPDPPIIEQLKSQTEEKLSMAETELSIANERIEELTKKLAQAIAPAPAFGAPVQTPLPPPMGRPSSIAQPPAPTPATPTLPGTTKDGRKIQWSHGVQTKAQ